MQVIKTDVIFVINFLQWNEVNQDPIPHCGSALKVRMKDWWSLSQTIVNITDFTWKWNWHVVAAFTGNSSSECLNWRSWNLDLWQMRCHLYCSFNFVVKQNLVSKGSNGSGVEWCHCCCVLVCVRPPRRSGSWKCSAGIDSAKPHRLGTSRKCQRRDSWTMQGPRYSAAFNFLPYSAGSVL